jgi:hypothetical protein
MMRRRFSATTLFLGSALLLACLCGGLAAAPGPQAEQGKEGGRNPAELIKGKWQATVAGHAFVFNLRLEDGDLVGTIELPNHKTVKVEDGICVVDEFSFSTVEDEVEWEWNGTISDAGLSGERERVDNDVTESFTAKRMP